MKYPPSVASFEERVAMALQCSDANAIPKVSDAGAIYEDENGSSIQIMHNGLRVLCGGYYGAWMSNLIRAAKGHHEPQEERVFHEVVKRLPASARMIELGGFWAYYSLWFLNQSPDRKAVVLEPEPAHLAVGQANAALNGLTPKFLSGFAGPQFAEDMPFFGEASGEMRSTCYSVAHLMSAEKWDYLDLLHCDIQGHEVAVLESCKLLFSEGKIGWVCVSTHAHQISGDPLTHQKCIDILQKSGARIVAEHDVHESFSGDGLIVACFGNLPDDWETIELSHNRHGTSLFRSLAYDLDETQKTLAAQNRNINAMGDLPDSMHDTLDRTGLLFTLKKDGPLGAAGQGLLVPDDKTMSPAIIADARWEYENLAAFAGHLKEGRRYTLLDIGANIGMFSRQIQVLSDQIEHALCVEPDHHNFAALKFNLAPFSDRVMFFNAALGREDGIVEFYRDMQNIGNYSLNEDAMRARSFEKVRVSQHDTQKWMAEHVSHKQALAWKSDTQGFDEVIITRTPMEIWERIDVALIEIWRIEKPDFDMDALRARFESFPNRQLGDEKDISVDEIIEYLSGSDWQFKDLLMWR
ncbi:MULTISPECIES: FkbM family methyltransferase [unclassified Ruegeria]|uniref:FkbM family methyltransferase n=1 Tax=unclassified Ruegeria TaxID=2625375 RepID=UPI001487A43B|nr:MULTISPECIES: FkbM family methyltransferase [unclassified Ruegeria]NOC85757.1 FkbM family methyltransferase [Ruegeria sp. HKCCD6428]NOC94154.1 FkbM family methyltransferase [Ruegeria sp. HKCCD6604]